MAGYSNWGYEEEEWDPEYDSTWEDEEDYEQLKQSTAKNAKRWSNRAAEDLQHYRHGYPDPMPNLRFYRNQMPFKPQGLYIETLLNKWKTDYYELERNHNFIQWLFPLREPGMNSHATPLTKKEIEEMKKDEVVMKRFLESYKLMLGFYGIELIDSKTGQLDRAKNWWSRFSNLNAKTHNNLRITRILKCLGELGYEHFQVHLVKFFLEETLCIGNLQNVQSSALDYFMFTVKNKSERKELVLYAWEKCSILNKRFKWGPVEILRKLRPPGAYSVTHSPNTFQDMQTFEDIEQENMGAQKNGRKMNAGATMKFRSGEDNEIEGSTTDHGLGENKENEEQSGNVRLANKETEGSNMESELGEDKMIEESLMEHGLVDSKSEDDKEKRLPLTESVSRHGKENGGALTGPRSGDDNDYKGLSMDRLSSDKKNGESRMEKEELPAECVLESNKEKEWSITKSRSEEDEENKSLSTESKLGEDKEYGEQSIECGIGDEKKHEMQHVQSVLGDINEKYSSPIKSGLRDGKENTSAPVLFRSGKAEENEGSLLKFGEDKGNKGQPKECGLGDEKKKISTPTLCENENKRILVKEQELDNDKKNRGAPSQLSSGDGTEKGSSPMELGLTENKDSDGSRTWCGLDNQIGGSSSEDGSTSDRNNKHSPIELGSGGNQEKEEPPMKSVLENNKEREGPIIRTGSGEDTENRGPITESSEVKENEKPLTQSELEEDKNKRWSLEQSITGEENISSSAEPEMVEVCKTDV